MNGSLVYDFNIDQGHTSCAYSALMVRGMMSHLCVICFYNSLHDVKQNGRIRVMQWLLILFSYQDCTGLERKTSNKFTLHECMFFVQYEEFSMSCPLGKNRSLVQSETIVFICAHWVKQPNVSRQRYYEWSRTHQHQREAVILFVFEIYLKDLAVSPNLLTMFWINEEHCIEFGGSTSLNPKGSKYKVFCM